MLSTMLTTLNCSGTFLPISDALRVGVATPLLGMLGPIISSGLDIHLEKLLRQHLLQLLVTACIYWPKAMSHQDASFLEQGTATMLGPLLQGSRHYTTLHYRFWFTPSTGVCMTMNQRRPLSGEHRIYTYGGKF